MTDAEFLDRLDAWALGGLSADEQAAMEQHLAANPALRPHVRSVFTTAAALGEALPPSPPPPGAWGRIAAALPAPRDTSATTSAAARRRTWTAIGWGLAAAAAAIAIWLWLDADGQRREAGRLRAQLAERDRADALRADEVRASRARLDGCVRDLEQLRARDALAGEAVALLELAGTQLIPLEPPAGRPANVAANAIYHRGVQKAYVVVKGLADDPAGYQIWVNRDGQRIPAGALAPGTAGGLIAAVAADSLDDVPESFEVTRPSGDVVLRSRIKI